MLVNYLVVPLQWRRHCTCWESSRCPPTCHWSALYHWSGPGMVTEMDIMWLLQNCYMLSH